MSVEKRLCTAQQYMLFFFLQPQKLNIEWAEREQMKRESKKAQGGAYTIREKSFLNFRETRKV